jgi:hypothetical protein
MEQCEINGAKLRCYSAWPDTSNPNAISRYCGLKYQTFSELVNAKKHMPRGHRYQFNKKVL